MGWFKKEKIDLICPVCSYSMWSLPSVTIFLNSKGMVETSSYEPWGTCKRCGNHSIFGRGSKPILLDQAGGVPVEVRAMHDAKRNWSRGRNFENFDRWSA